MSLQKAGRVGQMFPCRKHETLPTQERETSVRQLEGLRVVEWSEGIAAPYAAQILGDLGAQVVKVERPEGDWARQTGSDGHGATFMTLNRQKESVVINVKNEAGKETLWRIVESSDALITSYRPSVLSRLGFGDSILRERAPDMILGRIRAFGSGTDEQLDTGSDTIIQAISGMMTVAGGETTPSRISTPIIDLVAGRDLALGVLAALIGRHRNRGGTSKVVEATLFNSAASLLCLVWQHYFVAGTTPPSSARLNRNLAPGGVYSAKEGELLALAVLRDSHWQRLCEVLRDPRLERPEFATPVLRREHAQQLATTLSDLFSQYTRGEVIARLQDGGVLAAPVYSIPEIDADPWLSALLPTTSVQYGDRTFRSLKTPIAYEGHDSDESSSHPQRASRVPGSESRDVLRAAGLSDSEIDDLRASGVVQ